MIRQREKGAKKAHQKTVKELEVAIKNNVIEMHRLTDDETTPDEDLMSIAREQRFLKAKLRELKAPEAEVHYELSGKCLLFELKLGDRVVLDGLPGRPSVVWSADGGAARGHEREWRSSRSMLMAEGTAELFVKCCGLLVLLFLILLSCFFCRPIDGGRRGHVGVCSCNWIRGNWRGSVAKRDGRGVGRDACVRC